MKNYAWILLAISLVCLFGFWGLIKLFTVFNSADGERYRRMRMQGPFVPLSKEDIEDDECRKNLGN